MTDGITHISTSHQICLWITATLVGLCLLTAVPCIVLAHRDCAWLGYAGAAVGAAVAASGIFVAATFPPFAMQYHRYVRYSGTVYSIDSRLLGHDKSTTQQFPVVFEQDTNNIYRCDDSRCATIRKGDHVTLDCIRDFQLNATPGWKCNFVAVDRRTTTGAVDGR